MVNAALHSASFIVRQAATNGLLRRQSKRKGWARYRGATRRTVKCQTEVWKFRGLEAWFLSGLARRALVARSVAVEGLALRACTLRSLWPWKVCGFAAARSVLCGRGRFGASPLHAPFSRGGTAALYRAVPRRSSEALRRGAHQASLSRYHWMVRRRPVSKVSWGFQPSSRMILEGSMA